jgi:hypothetical protein
MRKGIRLGLECNYKVRRLTNHVVQLDSCLLTLDGSVIIIPICGLCRKFRKAIVKAKTTSTVDSKQGDQTSFKVGFAF